MGLGVEVLVGEGLAVGETVGVGLGVSVGVVVEVGAAPPSALLGPWLWLVPYVIRQMKNASSRNGPVHADMPCQPRMRRKPNQRKLNTEI